MRKPHYLKGNKSTELPNNCIWFDTETRYKLQSDGYEHHSLWFGWCAYSRRKANNEWTKPEWFMFKTIKQFWDFVESKTRPKTKLYLFCHNGAFDLPVLDAFNYLPSINYKMGFAVVDAPPMIIKWKKETRTIMFVDTLNIWRLPLAKIGDQLKVPKLTMPKSKRLTKEWLEYGRVDVEIIMLAIIQWFDFINAYDLGGFAATLASQAFNAYRHRFMDCKLLVHSNSKALELERQAYVGGRTECFRIGKYKGDFYHVDINSMYPYYMQTKDYPTQLIGVYTRVTKEELIKWLKVNCLIAEVELETEHNVFPVIYNDKLVFPTGRLSVTLSTPELTFALQHCTIIKIKRVAVYEKAKPFKDFITELYNQRLKADKEGREVDKWNLKIFMNSLYGKFGQRGRVYNIIDKVDNNDISVWSEIDLDTKEIINKRQFGGVIQEYKNEGESRESIPSIAAHVTAYARMGLYELIQDAKHENVYYMDTDCLLVNKQGYKNLQHHINESVLGKLKLEGYFKTIELHGAKDYKFGDKQVIKGVRKTATKLNHNTFEQVRFVGMAGLLRMGDLTAPRTTTVIKVLKRIYNKGILDSDGKVSPFRFTMF